MTTSTSEFAPDALPRLVGLVYLQMKDGEWTSLAELVEATGASESSASARLRDLRKPQYGGFHIERRKTLDGPFVYRLVTSPPLHDKAVEGVDEDGQHVKICADCWTLYPCPESPDAP